MHKMICRLCLKTLSKEVAVELFNENSAETELVKMIAKYFFFELSRFDAISTHICQDCCEHVEDFHRFWMLIVKKQRTLDSEILEFKSNLELSTVNEEKKKDILIDFNDESFQELKFTPDVEHALHKKELEEVLINNEAKNDLELTDNASISDDDVPLITLKAQGNRQKTTMKIKKEQFSDIDFENSTIIKALDFDATGKKVDHIYDDPLLSIKSNTIVKLNTTKFSAKCKKKKSIKNQKNRKDINEDGDQNEILLLNNNDNNTLQNETSKEKKPVSQNKTQRNREIISNFMTLTCDLCDVHTTVEDFIELRIHFQTVHRTDNAYIKCCGKKFERAGYLVDHITWHTNPDCFKCDICKKQLLNSNSLKQHKESQHQKIRLKGITLPCHLCKKVFRSEKCLENHVKRHSVERKEYICKICNKSFVSKFSLHNHIKIVHENINQQVCETCGKKFKCKASFERHVLEHQGIVYPPVQCHVCNLWVKNKEGLRSHLTSHDIKNTKCSFCDRICPTRTALRKHVSYWHKPQKIHQCKFCEKSFKASSSFEEHMAIHTGALLYSCPYCSKECRSRANMYVHIKRMHSAEWLKSKKIRSYNPQCKSLT